MKVSDWYYTQGWSERGNAWQSSVQDPRWAIDPGDLEEQIARCAWCQTIRLNHRCWHEAARMLLSKDSASWACAILPPRMRVLAVVLVVVGVLWSALASLFAVVVFLFGEDREHLVAVAVFWAIVVALGLVTALFGGKLLRRSRRRL